MSECSIGVFGPLPVNNQRIKELCFALFFFFLPCWFKWEQLGGIRLSLNPFRRLLASAFLPAHHTQFKTTCEWTHDIILPRSRRIFHGTVIKRFLLCQTVKKSHCGSWLISPKKQKGCAIKFCELNKKCILITISCINIIKLIFQTLIRLFVVFFFWCVNCVNAEVILRSNSRIKWNPGLFFIVKTTFIFTY